jgi:hypothetical protein
MANVSVTSHYDKWRPSAGWDKPIILSSPVPIAEITIRCLVNSTDIGIGDFVDLIQTVGDSTDLYDATLSADNTLTVAGIVPDTEWNKQQLAAANDVDTYAGLTKATACFDDNMEIDVVLCFPGLIVSCKVIDSVGAAGYKAFTKVQSAGSGRVDVAATAHAGIGVLLSQVVNLASVQWVAVMIEKEY